MGQDAVLAVTVKPCGHRLDLVGVAHPALIGRFDSVKQHALKVIYGDFSVFAQLGGGMNHFASQLIGYHLHAVAYTQQRYSQVVNLLGDLGGVFIENAARSARKDDAYGRLFAYFLRRYVRRHHFGINAEISYSSDNKLIVLSAEIHYQNQLIFHEYSPLCLRYFFL